MANLLPIELKKKIQKDNNKRFFIVFLFMIFIIVFVATLLFIPSYFLLSSREKAVGNLVAVYENSIVKNKDLKSDFNNIKKDIKVLTSQTNYLSIPYDIIDLIIKHKNDGVFIKNIVYDFESQEKDSEDSVISLYGIAKNRSSLQDFVFGINTEQRFNNIENPYSNYVNNLNLDFSIKIYIDNEKVKN